MLKKGKPDDVLMLLCKQKKSSYHMRDDLHIRAYVVHFHKHLKDNRQEVYDELFRFQN